MVGIAPVAFVPRIELVGLFPTVQTIAAQVLVFMVLAFGFRRKQA
jgi:high-affinity iron transporter